MTEKRMDPMDEVWCPNCERPSGVGKSRVVSATIPEIWPTDMVLLMLLRNEGHECDPSHVASRQIADLAHGL